MAADREALSSWWAGLSDAERAQARALAASGDPMPPEMLTSLFRAGAPQVGTYWLSSQAGPESFAVPEEVASFIEEQD